jgi:hypothetical protein
VSGANGSGRDSARAGAIGAAPGRKRRAETGERQYLSPRRQPPKLLSAGRKDGLTTRRSGSVNTGRAGGRTGNGVRARACEPAYGPPAAGRWRAAAGAERRREGHEPAGRRGQAPMLACGGARARTRCLCGPSAGDGRPPAWSDTREGRRPWSEGFGSCVFGSGCLVLVFVLVLDLGIWFGVLLWVWVSVCW